MTPSTPRDGVASARVADGLREAILTGEHKPGARIRQEDVAAQYGSSRLPVREALRMLEADGLVTVVANAGAWVSRLSLEECDELYRIRQRIEPLLLRYSIPNLDDAQINRLAQLALDMASVDDVTDFLRRDREFHLLSYAGADTLMLGDIIRRLWNRTEHYRRAYRILLMDSSSRILHDEHHMLVTAIRARDLNEAERVLAGHIRRTRLDLSRHPEIFT